MDGGEQITLTGVSRCFTSGTAGRITAVDNVTLSVVAGATVAITGPSGSGKSTLLHLLGAIDRPDHGSIFVGGNELTSLSSRALAAYRRGIGFIFQRHNLLPALTALDNVLAPVLPYRTSYDKQARARDLLDAVGLSGRGRELPDRLSGGEQQRVAVARALMSSPHLLLADEPTGNLDSVTGREILDLLMLFRRRYGMTIVLATHDMEVAARCQRLVRLHDGRVIEDTTIEETGPQADLLERISRLDRG